METDTNPDLLILTFPDGGSLSRWERFGVLERELGYIAGIARTVPRILCVSIEGNDERRIAAMLSQRFGIPVDAISQAEPDQDLGQSRTLEQRVLASVADARRVVIQTVQYDDGGISLRLLNPLRRAGVHVALVARGSFIASRVLANSRGAHHFATRTASEKERRLCASAQIVSGTSSTMVEELCWKHGIHTNRARVVSQPVNVPNDFVNIDGTRDKDRIVVTGRFSGECTAMRLAIESIALLTPEQRENLTLEIIGDGPDGLDLPAFAKARDVRVTMHRGVLHQGLLERLRGATIFLQPENARRQSITVLEAMALGCPVVVADLSEYNGLIENGSSGIRVIQEPRAYAFAIDCLLGDPGFRIMMGEVAHTRVSISCDPDRVISGMLDSFHDALDAAPKQGDAQERHAS